MSSIQIDVLRVLVLEDDAGDFMLLRAAVERFGRGGINLTQVRTLEEALVYIEENSVDLVVTDLNVTDSSGIETFRRLKGESSTLPIVVLSGHEDEQLGLQVVKEGAQDYLAKGDLGSQALVRCLAHSVERHRQQQELETARLQALAASQAKTLFLANISHEIRTPMNSILGMADLLLETGLSNDQLSYVDVFRRSGEALVEIINGLLDLSRVEAGQLQLESAPLPLWEVVEGVGELLAFSAHRKGISLSIDIQSDVPTWVLSDAGRLRQILVNLTNNAIKFTGKGEVVLQARLGAAQGEEHPTIELAIRDTGPGISPKHIDAIFESFTQADVSTSRQYGGSGLGLALSRRLAEAMGGQLTVTSVPDEGSEFVVSLSMATVEPPVGLVQEVKPSQLIGCRVLVAEPNETERLLLRRYLERVGCDVTECLTSREIVDVMETVETAGAPFDALVVAARLPTQGALDLVRKNELCQKYASRFIALMPANRRPGDMSEAKELGVAGCIQRPIRPSTLDQTLRSVVLQEELSAPVRESTPLTGKRVKLLVADDSIDNRSLIQAYAKGSPIEIVFAENGEEAFEHFIEQPFDLVLMDVQMPLMTGHEATSAIRAWERDGGRQPTPIVALTAYAFAEDREKSMEVGCDGHLVKPLRKAQFNEAVCTYTGSAQIDIEVDPELEDLAPGYLENRKADVSALRTHIESSDWDAIRILGHNMKGTGRGYGFDEITTLGADIEQAALNELEAETTTLIEKLSTYLGQVRLVSTEDEADKPDLPSVDS